MERRITVLPLAGGGGLVFSRLRQPAELREQLVNRDHLFTNARMMAMFTSTPRGLLSTLDSMPMPSRVKARGHFRRPPQLELDIAICDIKILFSSAVSLNMKSLGNRERFR